MTRYVVDGPMSNCIPWLIGVVRRISQKAEITLAVHSDFTETAFQQLQ